jgi:hypothetical protein
MYSEAIMELLLVSVPGCHHQGIIQNRGVIRPTANLGIVFPFFRMIKILKF